MTISKAAAAAAHRLAGAADPRPGVLVVESHVSAADAANDMVRRLGYRTVAASGMLAGWAALRETQFAVVLLEWQMVDMSEADGLMRLRHQDGTRFATASDTPAIALVQPGQAIDAERLRGLGFDDQLVRPLRASQVRAMLNKHMDSAVAEMPVAAPGMAPGTASGAASWFVPGSASGAPATAQVLDPAALARLAELDPTGESHLIERVLRAYKSSAERLRAQAGAARSSGDRKALRLVAHTLKSSSASIGALQLSHLCADIETAIRTQSEEGLGAQLSAELDAMDGTLVGVLQAIDRLLGPAP